MPKNFNTNMTALYVWDFDLEYRRRPRIEYAAGFLANRLDHTQDYDITLVILSILIKSKGSKIQWYHHGEHVSLLFQSLLIGRNTSRSDYGWMTGLNFSILNTESSAKALYKAIFESAKSVDVDIDKRLSMTVINTVTTQIIKVSSIDFPEN